MVTRDILAVESSGSSPDGSTKFKVMAKFKIGDKIRKPKGYKFPGTIVSVFENTKGQTRLVAEMEDIGILHIFNEDQLEHDE